jgi:hypothetical protein
MQLGEAIGDLGAPVVAHDERRLLADGVEQPDDIGDEVEHAVRLDTRWRIGPPAPSEVGGHHVVAGVGQAGQLVPPRVPQLRHPVDEQHQRPVACLGDVHRDAVGFDLAVCNRRDGLARHAA